MHALQTRANWVRGETLRGKKVSSLPGDKKKMVKEFLEAFVFKTDVQERLAS